MSAGPIRLALSEPAIRLFVIGSFLSSVGTWIQRIAVGWLVFDMTGSAAWVGAIAACEVIPSILVAPFAGVLVDTRDRPRLFAAGQTFALLQACVLAACALAGVLTLEVIVAASVALGMIEGLNQPARLAIVSDVAPRDLIRPAISLNSLGFNTARFIGPASGGIALATGGPVAAFALNALSFTPFIFLIFLLRRKHLTPQISERLSMQAGILGGVQYAARHVMLGPIFLMLITMSLSARSFLELLPAISGLWFDSSPERLASLTSAVGLGAIAGGQWILRRKTLRHVLAAVLTLPGLLIAVVFLFAMIGQQLIIAHVLLGLAGFSIVAAGVGMQSVIHLSVDPALRGRVLSLYGLIQRALPAVGALVIGYATDLAGLRIPLVASCAVAAVVWLLVWMQRHRIVNALPAE